jgi:ribosome-associated protein
MSDGSVRVGSGLAIPLSELTFRATRSGGPGGQHVNTSSTRVELVWDVSNSPSLTPEQRDRIQEKLAGRMSGEGVLSLASSATRSQYRNREDAIRRFARLVEAALERPQPRRPTRPTRAAKEQRLESKKRRAALKRARRSPDHD